MSNQCEHGSLRRSCEICQRDEEIEQYQKRIAEMQADYLDLKAELDAWRAATGCASMTPEEAGAKIDRDDEERLRMRPVVEAAGELEDEIAEGLDDERLRYVEVQIDREALENFHFCVRAYRAGEEVKP